MWQAHKDHRAIQVQPALQVPLVLPVRPALQAPLVLSVQPDLQVALVLSVQPDLQVALVLPVRPDLQVAPVLPVRPALQVLPERRGQLATRCWPLTLGKTSVVGEVERQLIACWVKYVSRARTSPTACPLTEGCCPSRKIRRSFRYTEPHTAAMAPLPLRYQT